MSIPRNTRGKRRFTAPQARLALLEAGVELLGEVGLESGLARITFSAAVERSGVPRPSAYRVFSDGAFDPQDEYRMSLLLHLLEVSASNQNLDDGFDAAGDSATELIGHLQSGDGDRMAFVLREGIRLGTNLMWQGTTVEEAAFLAAAISLVVDPEPHPPLLDAYRRHRAVAVATNMDFYGARLDLFGLRMRRGLELADLASVLGMARDQIWDGNLTYGPEPVFHRSTGLDGELQAWTPFGVTCEGIVLAMVEPDPDAPQSARLASWLET